LPYSDSDAASVRRKLTTSQRSGTVRFSLRGGIFPSTPLVMVRNSEPSLLACTTGEARFAGLASIRNGAIGPFPSPVAPWHIWQWIAYRLAPRVTEASSASVGFSGTPMPGMLIGPLIGIE